VTIIPSSPSQSAAPVARLLTLARRAVLAGLVAALAASAQAAPKLAISPSSTSVTAGGHVTFSASGGAGGYHYSLSASRSGGSVDADTGDYTAGATGGVSDEVTVTDSAGTSQKALVKVTALTQATPDLGGHR
jgi:hypothetical protein